MSRIGSLSILDSSENDVSITFVLREPDRALWDGLSTTNRAPAKPGNVGLLSIIYGSLSQHRSFVHLCH